MDDPIRRAFRQDDDAAIHNGQHRRCIVCEPVRADWLAVNHVAADPAPAAKPYSRTFADEERRREEIATLRDIVARPASEGALRAARKALERLGVDDG